MTAVIIGPRTWSGSRDSEGHRTYKIKTRVRCDPGDGPATILQTPGLPEPGHWWLLDNDIDLWAWCQPDAVITPVLEGEPNFLFDIEQTFSTKPPEKKDWKKQRCQDTQIQDPILEPPKIAGSFVRYSSAAAYDRFRNRLVTSSAEPITGQQVEFDSNRPNVKIDQNVIDINIPLLTSMVDTVNSYPIWGVPRRCVKLSSATWERRFYGACYMYFNRTLEFDVSCMVPLGIAASTATIAAAGSNYQVGDILQLVGGVYSRGADVVVTSVSGGTITGAVVSNPGAYNSVPANPTSTRFINRRGSGTVLGSGATFNITWGAPIVSGFDKDAIDTGTKVLRGRWEQVSGTGCKISVNAVTTGGGILSAGVVVGSEGTGYPKLAVIALKLTSGSNPGSGGIVQVVTDQNGIPRGFYDVYLPGLGYTAPLTIYDTVNASKKCWVLSCDVDSGDSPSSYNPGDFMAFVDQQHNKTKATLDGWGMPIGAIYNDKDQSLSRLPYDIHIEVYTESDFSLLGIPLSLT